MGYLLFKLAVGGSMLAVSQTAMAQSSFSNPAFSQLEADRFAQPDLQARLSLTVPFGGQTSNVNSKSKLSLGFRAEEPSSFTSNSLHQEWMMRSSDVREIKFGFTLESSPHFLINDQVILSPVTPRADEDGSENEGGLDTYDKTVLTVIGASLAVIAGSIIIVAD